MTTETASLHFPNSVGLFEFSGQATLDAWTITEALEAIGWSRYEYALAHEPELCFQRIRELVGAFPTWQRLNRLGRPPIDERVILIGLLVRQFLKATFRATESYLRILAEFFRLDHVPDASTLSLKNRSRRFLRLLERFHLWFLERLPDRKVTIATDATGFGPQKRSWRATPFPYRANEHWVKANCAVEIPTMLILSTTLLPGRTFESLAFEETWDKLPNNVLPVRSLADSAFSGQSCVESAVAHGATPFHAIPENARTPAKPVTERDKMVHFAKHWPNRAARLRARRALIETVFAMIKEIFGERLQCRSWAGRLNEALAKVNCHNIRIVAIRGLLVGHDR